MLEDKIHIPFVGVMPWTEIELEDEDSVTERFARVSGEGEIDVAIVKLKHISNFTDFSALSLTEGVKVRYARTAKELEGADIIILPGTKNTIEDLIELNNHGVGAQIVRHARSGGIVFGVCGGYQMLGGKLSDPMHTESRVSELAGLGLLDMEVEFLGEKTTVQAAGVIDCACGWLSELSGTQVDGYEIHSGVNRFGADAIPWLTRTSREGLDGVCNRRGNVLGSYMHGLFDQGRLWRALVDHARAEKGLDARGGDAPTLAEFREREFDRLAAVARANLDMEKIYKIMRGEA
jgi:adenosylcobyric acid synthase